MLFPNLPDLFNKNFRCRFILASVSSAGAVMAGRGSVEADDNKVTQKISLGFLDRVVPVVGRATEEVHART